MTHHMDSPLIILLLQDDSDFQPSLFRLSDEGGSLEFSLVSEGSIPRSGLDPSDVFIADTGKEVHVWIGGSASPDEKKNAMTYAHVSRVRAYWPGIQANVS